MAISGVFGNQQDVTYSRVDGNEHETKHYDDRNDSTLDQYQDLQRRLRTTKRLLIAVSCVLAFAVLILVGSVFKNPAKDFISSKLSDSSDGQDKLLSPVPEMPKESVVFNRDDRYAAPSTVESDRAWHQLMPIGDGFVIVNESQRFNLQPGKQTPDGELYDISLFHQLHCLTMIRTYLYTLLFSVDRNNTKEVHDVLLAPQDDHIHHCFDYLRQGIMCAGDMTVEWPREEPDGRRFAVNGWGIPHQCKSWDAIMEYMDTHHSPSALGAQVGH